MSLNHASLQYLASKGFSLDEIIEFAAVSERKADPTNAERQARHRSRKRNAVTVTPNPPIDINHTPCSDNLTDVKLQNAVAVFPKPLFCESDEIWRDFLANRKRKRLPNTATAHKGFLDDITRIADDEWPPGRLLTHAVSKGWGGIYDPRENGNGRQANRGGDSYGTSTGDIARRIANEG